MVEETKQRERERDGGWSERERQRKRQTDRQTDRETETDRQTETETEKDTHREGGGGERDAQRTATCCPKCTRKQPSAFNGTTTF